MALFILIMVQKVTAVIVWHVIHISKVALMKDILLGNSSLRLIMKPIWQMIIPHV